MTAPASQFAAATLTLLATVAGGFFVVLPTVLWAGLVGDQGSPRGDRTSLGLDVAMTLLMPVVFAALWYFRQRHSGSHADAYRFASAYSTSFGFTALLGWYAAL